MLRKNCRTSKDFAGPVEPRCYWSYRASNSLSKPGDSPEVSQQGAAVAYLSPASPTDESCWHSPSQVHEPKK